VLTDSDKKNGITSNINEYRDLVPVCVRENLDVFAPVKDLTDNNAYVYFRNIWNKEKYIAEKLFDRKISNGGSKSYIECSDQDLKEAEADIAQFSGRTIVLDECQKEAIRSAFEHKITVITGGGGTGKSTICRCIYHLASENSLSIRMMSPTGKASQVLTAKTDYPAATIHRSLRMTPDDDYPREEIQEDIVLVDEVSMVGVDTMFAIFVALNRNPWAHLVFVGDSNQLPSVSPGNFLSDIMASGCANTVRLDKIHRQDENSYISVVANDIAKGKIASIPDTATDIRLHEITDPENFKDEIQKSVNAYLKKNGGIEDLQIIAPMYKGNCGVNIINETIQEMMAMTSGHSDKTIQRGKTKFYLGDRIIQTANNYDKQVFNGDMGIIIEIGKKVIDSTVNDKEEEYIIVDFHGNENRILYRSSEIDQIRPAWCVTVHKFQGSQSPDIIFVMAREARIMMSKELVYTGITRAEKNVDIYGNDDMLRLAPTKSVIKKRYTNMNKIIKGLRESRQIFQVLDPPKQEEKK
jgi:exodeoxyribonuclease V alpha subunit